MKKFLGLSLVIAGMWMGCDKVASSAAADSYVIKGKIEGLKDGPIYLFNPAEQKVLDTTEVKGGEFSFSGKLAEPELLAIAQQSPISQFYAENATIEINGKLSDMPGMTITGSKSQDEFKKFQGIFKPVNDKYQPIFQQLNTEMQTNGMTTPAGQESQRKLEGVQGEFMAIIKDSIKNYIKRNPASPLNAFIAVSNFNPNQTMGISAKEMEEVYGLLSEPAKNSKYGKIFTTMLEAEKKWIGEQAPDFGQNDVNGKEIRLSSYKGKYVLIDFWASWCKPCRGENPNVVRTYNEFKNKNFEILGVSLDQEKGAWVDAIKQDNLTWKHVSDLKGFGNQVAQMFGVSAIPYNFLVDPNGVIIAKNLRSDALRKKLEEVLK